MTVPPGSRLRGWFDRPWLILFALLAFEAQSPSSSVSLTLKGHGGIESERAGAQIHGYYEGLLAANAGPRTPGPDKVAPPPPGWRPFAESGLMEERTDYLRWRLRPGAQGPWNGTRFRVNALGARGPERDRAKPPRTFRIVVLGSSNTMGHGVDDEVVYCERLERWLDEYTGPGVRIEVINLAVSGDSPTQRLRRIEEEVPPLNPDWLLCDATVLDLSLEEAHLRWVVDRKVAVPYEFVRRALDGGGLDPKDSPLLTHKKLRPFSGSLLEGAYAGWSRESRRLGVPLTVVILPRADSQEPSPRLFRQIRGLAERQGLSYHDLSDAFGRLEPGQYRVAPWDPHPNAEGHRLIFERLKDELCDDAAFCRRLVEAGAWPRVLPGNG